MINLGLPKCPRDAACVRGAGHPGGCDDGAIGPIDVACTQCGAPPYVDCSGDGAGQHVARHERARRAAERFGLPAATMDEEAKALASLLLYLQPKQAISIVRDADLGGRSVPWAVNVLGEQDHDDGVLTTGPKLLPALEAMRAELCSRLAQKGSSRS